MHCYKLTLFMITLIAIDHLTTTLRKQVPFENEMNFFKL